MFTGIVTDIGHVVAVHPRADELRRLKIACGYERAGIADGASIACNGVCLTVVGAGEDGPEWTTAKNMFSVFGALNTTKVADTTGKLFKMLGVTTASGSISPSSTMVSTSTTVSSAAIAITGLKFRADLK